MCLGAVARLIKYLVNECFQTHIVFAPQLRQRWVRQNKRSEPDRTKLAAFARVTR
jgi:hypothetical protein